MHLSGLEVSTLRFLLGAVFMLPFALRAPKQTWKDGGWLGLIVLVSYVSQAYGLQYISSNRSAFLTSLNVLMVPLLGIFFGARPTLVVFVAALIAVSGIGLMSWDGGAHFWGDAATVLGAFAYALDVILLAKVAKRHVAHQLAATQIIWMAIMGSLWMGLSALGTDRLETLPERVDGTVLAGLIYLGVIAGAGMLFLQAVAQRHVTADKAALVYAMEPVFAAMFAWMWLGEMLTAQAAIGGVMVVAAVILSELPCFKPGATPKSIASD